MSDATSFPGFFVGGFECSSHRLASGRRLDLPATTGHVAFADADYRRLADVGIGTARDGFAWHRVEATSGRRDFSSVVPVVRAARRAGVRVVWDLMHFGWPDDVDVWTPAWIDRFAALTHDFMQVLSHEGDGVPWISPINEISFLAWAAGDVAMFAPAAIDRGFELKCQLVRATIAAIEAARRVEPRVRVVIHDPAFHVVPVSDDAPDVAAAEASRLLQFQGCDLLSGRLWPQLGGRSDYLDVVGVNYYPWNQWTFGTRLVPGAPISQADPRHRPLSAILVEWARRYERPIYVGETGCEGDRRAGWLRHVCDEVVAARALGAPVEGVCLYPIVDFPGWEDDRVCENGLWGTVDAGGHRDVHEPLAAVLRAQQRRFSPRADAPLRIASSTALSMSPSHPFADRPAPLGACR